MHNIYNICTHVYDSHTIRTYIHMSYHNVNHILYKVDHTLYAISYKTNNIAAI